MAEAFVPDLNGSSTTDKCMKSFVLNCDGNIEMVELCLFTRTFHFPGVVSEELDNVISEYRVNSFLSRRRN